MKLSSHEFKHQNLKTLATMTILISYFGVNVDGHKTILGFGISAISEHSTV